MRKIILMSFLFINCLLQAQFTIKGTINNYSNKRVIVKLNNAFDDFLVGNLITDHSGNFSISIKSKYIGVIEVSLLDAKVSHLFISDNTNINFVSTLKPDNSYEIDKAGNNINQAYQDHLNYSNKSLALPNLEYVLSLYRPGESFYNQLSDEIKRISQLKQSDTSQYPFLSYYIPASDLVNSLDSNLSEDESKELKNKIIEHIENAGEEFETSGLGRPMLYGYLKLITTGVTTKAQWENSLDKGIQNLLDTVGEDTARGQEVLSASINFLNAYGATNVANKYISRAESLTCEISKDLKKTLAMNKSIKEGNAIPNIKFTHKLDGKYSSLYDIKTKYKLVLVWASWCSHCKQELPFVKIFYENFKKAGGEIIGLSIDYDKEEWNNVVKDLPWLNDSDFLYWDSKYIEELNVSGTPTLFLIDKNNKILKITSKISEINNLIN